MDKVTTVLNNLEPKSNNTLWLKPVSGGFAAYLREQGAYKPLKLVDDNDTPSTDDDTPVDPSEGFTGQIIMNGQGISPDSEGNIDLGTVITSHQDISGKADAEKVESIEALIPTQATEQNQLADKGFVNSSIATATADFKGTVNSVAALNNITANNNDYAFVVATDSDGNTVYKRYKYDGNVWVFEYDLNNSSFTAAQWASIQSGITAGIVENLHDSNNLVRGTVVHNIAVLTQAQYDVLTTKDANTEYNIIESV